jgi:UDP-2,3-diacylglucosamine pyrophosphatase LpxH
MKQHIKTLYISDIHLNTPFCKAENLLILLKQYKYDNLVMVGDILDLYPKSVKLTKTELEVVHKILSKAKKGVRVVWVLGNHDDKVMPMLEYVNNVAGIEICQELHVVSWDRNVLVMHGDVVDLPIVKHLYFLGDYCYTAALFINHWYNAARRLFGLGYYSLSSELKKSVKDAVKYISDYENKIADYAKHKGFNTVISGHIHHAEIKRVNGVLYMNCGDFVESCTAIVEKFDGEFQLVKFDGKEFV